jgi:hypothetical protein
MSCMACARTSCSSRLSETNDVLNCLLHQLSHFRVIKEGETQFQKHPFQHCKAGNRHGLTGEKRLQGKWLRDLDWPGRL